jgi:DNA-binding MarR family transcriptional regulator
MNKYTKFKLVGELDATISGKLIFLLLLDVIDENNKITISQRKVSEALGIHKGTVSKNLRKLYNDGYIEIIPTYNECGGRMPNEYIVWEAPE